MVRFSSCNCNGWGLGFRLAAYTKAARWEPLQLVGYYLFISWIFPAECTHHPAELVHLKHDSPLQTLPENTANGRNTAEIQELRWYRDLLCTRPHVQGFLHLQQGQTLLRTLYMTHFARIRILLAYSRAPEKSTLTALNPKPQNPETLSPETLHPQF